ncbi:MAG TPA: 50S ribosomal protein L11 methyltransferase [Thermoanaerobaculia bacterium]|jgi:protein arginine N-methyltransferase 1|nr:50S ribosomal protein L11 methyltransferase [Thermoanaerobaculia bacterium]
MDWNAPYIISGSLRLEISPAGKLVLSGSPSRKPQEAQLDSIPVLLGFATGATPRDVFYSLQKDWEIEEAGFAEVVEMMEVQELLTPAGESENGPRLPDHGFGSVRAHFVMLKDPVRVLSYKSAIERHARGENVAEIGCGTGVLSLFAARAGARRVTAIEETRISQVAARMFEANGYSGLIDLRVANSRDVELDEPADLIIHEILGVDPFEENLLPYLDDARRRLLRPGGRFLPYRLEVCCMGIELEEPPPAEDRTLEEAREFSGLYGLDFGPFLEALAGSRSLPATSRTWIEGKSRFGPRILSEEQRFLDIDFARDPLDFDGHTAAIPLRIVREGLLEGAVVFFRAHLDEQTQLTTSPLAPPTSWGWSLRHFSKRAQVSPGGEVTLTVEFGHRGGAQGLKLDLA